MNKKLALITLIQHSISFADEAKIALLKHVNNMTAEEIEKLGKYLVHERQFALDYEEAIVNQAKQLVDTSIVDTVYIGKGQPD